MDNETLRAIEAIASKAVFITLVLSGVAYAVAWAARGSRTVPRVGAGLAGAGLAGCAAVFISRGLQPEAPRLPLTTLYEFAVMFTAGIVAFYLVASLRWDLRNIGTPVMALACAVFGLGSKWYQAVEPTLMPALNSVWLNIHVVTAMLAYGPLAVGAMTGAYALVLYAREGRGGRRAAAPRGDGDGEASDAKHLTGDDLDDITYRTIAFSFPWLTALIITGAIWAQYAWGTYWAWDVKEVWSLITWIIYAAYLHMRLMRGWKGRVTAAFGVIGLALVLFTWVGVQWLATHTTWVQSLHTY